MSKHLQSHLLTFIYQSRIGTYLNTITYKLYGPFKGIKVPAVNIIPFNGRSGRLNILLYALLISLPQLGQVAAVGNAITQVIDDLNIKAIEVINSFLLPRLRRNLHSCDTLQLRGQGGG